MRARARLWEPGYTQCQAVVRRTSRWKRLHRLKGESKKQQRYLEESNFIHISQKLIFFLNLNYIQNIPTDLSQSVNFFPFSALHQYCSIASKTTTITPVQKSKKQRLKPLWMEKTKLIKDRKKGIACKNLNRMLGILLGSKLFIFSLH